MFTYSIMNPEVYDVRFYTSCYYVVNGASFEV